MELRAVKVLSEPADRKTPFLVRINSIRLNTYAASSMAADIVAWITGDPLWSSVKTEAPADLVDYLKNLESILSINGLALRARQINAKIAAASMDNKNHLFTLPSSVRKDLRFTLEVTNTMLLMYNSLFTSKYREYKIDGEDTIVGIGVKKTAPFCRIMLKRNNISIRLYNIRRLTVSDFFNLLVIPIPTFIGFLYTCFNDPFFSVTIKSPEEIDISKLVAEHGVNEALKMIETAIEKDMPVAGLEALGK